MPIYPSSWGWRHKTSIGNLKQGYYPIVCIVPLFLAPAFSNFALRLSNQMGVCQCMSMHIMHIAVLFVSEQSSWQLVSCHTGCTICSASIAGAHHRDSGISIHFEHVSGCRPTLCPLGRSKSLPLPALASQGPSTRRSGQTLQHFNAY